MFGGRKKVAFSPVIVGLCHRSEFKGNRAVCCFRDCLAMSVFLVMIPSQRSNVGQRPNSGHQKSTTDPNHFLHISSSNP